MSWDIYWTTLGLIWVLGFAGGETIAIYTGGKTLSEWVWELHLAWGPFDYLFGFVTGGVACHFFWHWLPVGAKSTG